jgi:hypothetical protein
MATSYELKTAARVLREQGYDAEEAIADLEADAEKAYQQERYVGMLGSLIKPQQHPNMNGARVIQQLVDDGWTPPEFLR